MDRMMDRLNNVEWATVDSKERLWRAYASQCNLSERLPALREEHGEAAYRFLEASDLDAPWTPELVQAIWRLSHLVFLSDKTDAEVEETMLVRKTLLDGGVDLSKWGWDGWGWDGPPV